MTVPRIIRYDKLRRALALNRLRVDRKKREMWEQTYQLWKQCKTDEDRINFALRFIIHPKRFEDWT